MQHVDNREIDADETIKVGALDEVQLAAALAFAGQREPEPEPARELEAALRKLSPPAPRDDAHPARSSARRRGGPVQAALLAVWTSVLSFALRVGNFARASAIEAVGRSGRFASGGWQRLSHRASALRGSVSRVSAALLARRRERITVLRTPMTESEWTRLHAIAACSGFSASVVIRNLVIQEYRKLFETEEAPRFEGLPVARPATTPGRAAAATTATNGAP